MAAKEFTADNMMLAIFVTAMVMVFILGFATAPCTSEKNACQNELSQYKVMENCKIQHTSECANLCLDTIELTIGVPLRELPYNLTETNLKPVYDDCMRNCWGMFCDVMK